MKPMLRTFIPPPRSYQLVIGFNVHGWNRLLIRTQAADKILRGMGKYRTVTPHQE